MNRLKGVLLFIVWFLFIGAGFFQLMQYENKPGYQRVMGDFWPSASSLKLFEAPYTLVMGVHPQCPCTRATIEELAMVMAHSQNQLKGYALFIQPAGFEDDWVKTDTYRSVSVIPGIQNIIDQQGKQADLFHLTTSGQILVYDKRGKMLFNGGITASRGYAGDNEGVRSVIELVRTGKAPKQKTSFFGCPLF